MMPPNNPPGGPSWGAPPPSAAPQTGGPAFVPGMPPSPMQGVAVAPPPTPVLPSKLICPVCTTTFAPRRTRGRCPICGEQVVPAGDASRNLPVITPVTNWMFHEGNWRLVAVVALVLYQIIIFIVLWIHLAQIHAL
ncbi:MAG: hypothetical protein ACXWQZ_04585 [Ktedonobacterales bacterium]